MAVPGYTNLSAEFLAAQNRAGNLAEQGRRDQLGPIRRGSPEEEGAAPIFDRLIVTSPEASWIGGAWMNMLLTNADKVLSANGGDMEVFDDLLDDDVAMSNLQQRRLAITSREWEVAPGDPDDARSVQAADDLRAMLKGVGWDRVTGFMHFAVWYGYAVGEAMFTTKDHDGRRIVWLNDIVVPDRRWFGFTVEGELRLSATTLSAEGDALPANKFWTVRTGATHDFAFYGLGLAHWCYWPIFFKRAAIKFWALYLEKYGRPTTAIEYEEGDDDDVKGKRLAAAQQVGHDSAVLVPPGTLKDKLQIMEATRSGGANSYKDFVTEQNEALMRVVLGQPGTSKATAQGVGGKQSEVHEGVKDEIVKADSDLISESFGNTIAKWLTLWNHGEDVAPPSVFRVLEDAEDLNTVAERDTKLNGIGIKRTEESVREVYGDGYEVDRISEADKAAQAAALAQAKAAPGAPVPANDNRARVAAKRIEFGVEDRAPLYVSRQLLPESARALLKWAKDAGFSDLEPASELHCTVLYSRTPVDWFDMGESWQTEVAVVEGGPRRVEKFDDEAIVLRFVSSDMRWRHDSMIERGASHDHDDYRPHVTFAHSAEGVDLATLEPFTGELKFGPEIFEPIKAPDPAALAFTAGEADAIDRLVDRLLDETSPVFEAMADEFRAKLQGVTTAEGARVALLEAWERMPIERLARMTALPLLAARATADAGAENAVA